MLVALNFLLATGTTASAGVEWLTVRRKVMYRLQPRWIALAIALCATAACSQTGSAPAAQTNASSIAPAQPTDSSDSHRLLDCAKILSSSDVADLLTAPVTMKKTGGDGTDCNFTIASGASITVSFATGSDGRYRWKTASDPTLGMVPMPGLGDKAMKRSMSAGVDVVATKGDVLCWATMVGTNSVKDTGNITKLRGDALATKIGELCNKGFSSH